MPSPRKTPRGFLRLGKPEERTPFSETTNVRERLLLRGIKPRKRWGQNFLTRADTAQRIVDAVGLAGDETVLEIGPGAGALTGRLAAAAARVVAVEFDRGLADLLEEDLGGWGKVEIVRGDVLDLDLDALALRLAVDRLTVVGNVPYAITTAILEWLIEGRRRVAQAVLLVQKEYAARLAAAAGTADYGSLTLFARYHLRLDPLFHVPPGAFWPRPEVDSTLVRLRFRPSPPVEVPDEERFFALIRASFQQRRKTLGTALLPLYDRNRVRCEKALHAAHIASKRRGETLELEEFARLARHEVPFRGEAAPPAPEETPPERSFG